jgi:hypothetical protein
LLGSRGHTALTCHHHAPLRWTAGSDTRPTSDLFNPV